ncbi:MAG: FtsX-like permease family protein [Chloroflexi bacterium]|nr:FtsX-like permease family protein [Chloroflexota bacterium]
MAVDSAHDNPEDNDFARTMAELTGAMNLLGIIAMIVSGFLVTNVMNTVILEQRRQIGAMKTLGATLIDNFLIYAGMALVYGMIGTALGLLLAVPIAASAARPVASWLAAYIEGYQFSPDGLSMGAVMGLVVPVFASLVPVLQTTRLSILDAVTDMGISSTFGQSRLARGIGRLPLPIPVAQAVSNIWQKRGRLTLTMLTLTVAGGAFMGATAVGTSMDSWFVNLIGIHNYQIRISPQRASDYDQIAAHVREVEGVDGVYPGLDVLVSIPDFVSIVPISEGSDQVVIAGLDPATPAYKFNLMAGTGWQNDPSRAGMVISRSVAEALDKQVGDTLTFVVNGQSHSYEIIGIDAYVFDGIFMDWRELARVAGYVDTDGQPLVGSAYVMLDGEPSIEAVNAKIDEITAVLSALNIQGTYHNRIEIEDMIAEEASVISLIFQLMSVVMAAVGAVGLMAALSMAVFERQKEIGVMRSIGARSRAVMGQFMLEGVFIGLIAWVMAIPISVVLSRGLLSVLPIIYLELDFPLYLIAYGLAGVLVVVGLASLGPSLMASRKTVADILRYQ